MKKKYITHLGYMADVASDKVIAALTKELFLEKCSLCNTNKPAYLGIFSTASEEFGALPGKVRLIRYELCEECYSKPNVAEAAEALILYMIRKDAEGEDVQ